MTFDFRCETCIEVWQAKIEQKCYVVREHSIYKYQIGSLGGRLGDGDSCAGVFFILFFSRSALGSLPVEGRERKQVFRERERIWAVIRPQQSLQLTPRRALELGWPLGMFWVEAWKAGLHALVWISHGCRLSCGRRWHLVQGSFLYLGLFPVKQYN